MFANGLVLVMTSCERLLPKYHDRPLRTEERRQVHLFRHSRDVEPPFLPGTIIIPFWENSAKQKIAVACV